MSTDTVIGAARAPKRARGRQRVTELLRAAGSVFAERGYEAATMTEIAARAAAPIGSLYQFFPSKELLADRLLQDYAALLAADLEALRVVADRIATRTLVESLFGLVRAHPRERAAALPLAEARMDERTRQATFRHMLRRHIAAILRARARALPARDARDMAIVLAQLMKAAGAIKDEEALPGRSTALRDLRELAVHYLEQRLHGRT